MTHLASTLPPEVEIGAHRSLRYSTDIVTMDGGNEVRNARWATPLRTYEINYPPSTRDDANYLAIIALYDEALGMLHSFTFHDWADDEDVAVRFDSPLELNGLAIHLDQIVSVRLVEVRLDPDT